MCYYVYHMCILYCVYCTVLYCAVFALFLLYCVYYVYYVYCMYACIVFLTVIYDAMLCTVSTRCCVSKLCLVLYCVYTNASTVCHVCYIVLCYCHCSVLCED